jgi:hypothetical protein
MATKLSKPDLFEALGYKPHAGQLLVHRSTAPRRVLSCGVRWGKSTCGVMESLAALLQPRERTLGWIVGPTYALSRLIFERTAVLALQRFKHRVREYSQRDQRLVMVNFGGGRSVLEGKTADHPASLLGESLDFVVVDEAAAMQERVWTEHLSQRLLDRRGWALFLSTPRGRNWFYRLYRRGQKGRDPAYESWASPSWTNPHLDRELIEAEQARLPPESYAEQYCAEFRGEELESCDVCGGPSPSVSGVVALLDGDELSECKECQRPVDASGHTVVHRRADGRPSLMVISLQDRKDGTRPKVEVAKTVDQKRPLVVRMRDDSERFHEADLQAREP